MKVKVNVTQRDIDNGTRWDGDCCPIALAVKRVARRGVHITVSCFGYAYVGSGKAAPMPECATKFVSRFDRYRKVKPFSFTLDLPKSVLKARKA